MANALGAVVGQVRVSVDATYRPAHRRPVPREVGGEVRDFTGRSRGAGRRRGRGQGLATRGAEEAGADTPRSRLCAVDLRGDGGGPAHLYLGPHRRHRQRPPADCGLSSSDRLTFIDDAKRPQNVEMSAGPEIFLMTRSDRGAGLQVAERSPRFIEDEALPGTGVEPARFWSGLRRASSTTSRRRTARCCRARRAAGEDRRLAPRQRRARATSPPTRPSCARSATWCPRARTSRSTTDERRPRDRHASPGRSSSCR